MGSMYGWLISEDLRSLMALLVVTRCEGVGGAKSVMYGNVRSKRE